MSSVPLYPSDGQALGQAGPQSLCRRRRNGPSALAKRPTPCRRRRRPDTRGSPSIGVSVRTSMPAALNPAQILEQLAPEFLAEGTEVRKLPAGGRRIRTLGPPSTVSSVQRKSAKKRPAWRRAQVYLLPGGTGQQTGRNAISLQRPRRGAAYRRRPGPGCVGTNAGLAGVPVIRSERALARCCALWPVCRHRSAHQRLRGARQSLSDDRYSYSAESREPINDVRNYHRAPLKPRRRSHAKRVSVRDAIAAPGVYH